MSVSPGTCVLLLVLLCGLRVDTQASRQARDNVTQPPRQARDNVTQPPRQRRYHVVHEQNQLRLALKKSRDQRFEYLTANTEPSLVRRDTSTCPDRLELQLTDYLVTPSGLQVTKYLARHTRQTPGCAGSEVVIEGKPYGLVRIKGPTRDLVISRDQELLLQKCYLPVVTVNNLVKSHLNISTQSVVEENLLKLVLIAGHVVYIAQVTFSDPGGYHVTTLAIDPCSQLVQTVDTHESSEPSAQLSSYQFHANTGKPAQNLGKSEFCDNKFFAVGGNSKLGQIRYGYKPFCVAVTSDGSGYCLLQNNMVAAVDMKNKESPMDSQDVVKFPCNQSYREVKVNGAPSPLLDGYFYLTQVTRMLREWYGYQPSKNRLLYLRGNFGWNCSNAFQENDGIYLGGGWRVYVPPVHGC
ncbi:elastase-like [Physella acuta]|uniref:elastase-like n=1 Tax=Physella acuta TaxID=109671 RepID=UPI0027DC9BB6|nr:elastase-like [Physella acuta]